MQYSILVSQIGYRPHDAKRAVICSKTCDHIKPELGAGEVQEATEQGEEVTYEIAYWGEKWGHHYWVMDFTPHTKEGEYRIHIPSMNQSSECFKIEEHVWRERTLMPVAIRQLGVRTGDKMGWQDCGSDLRAVEGNAMHLIGLVDCYQSFEGSLGDDEKQAFLDSIRRGADYLVACQRDDGSFMNEYYVERTKRSWTLCMIAVVALSRTYSLIHDVAYHQAARSGWDWAAQKTSYSREERMEDIQNTRKIFGRYEPWIPPKGLRTRDRLLVIWAGALLYENTNDLRFKERATKEADCLYQGLQVQEDDAVTDGIYGMFRAWDGVDIYQKGWEHSGWGYNCGAILPDEMSGILLLMDMFGEDESYHKWYAIAENYAYGYMLPASKLSPFGIMPLGVFEGEVKFFGPSWHGFNGMYGRYARLSMLFAKLFEDMQFQEIAIHNMQWIAGLNAGCMDEDGELKGLSMINGVGTHAFTAWTDVTGSVCNGFCANPQFKLAHLDDMKDTPRYVNNEDWLVHSGAWLSGLAEVERKYSLKIKTQYKGKPVKADVLMECGEGARLTTGAKGLLRTDGLPVGESIKIKIGWQSKTFAYEVKAIAGLQKVIALDFADHMVASLERDVKDKTLVLHVHNHGLEDCEASIYIRGLGIEVKEQSTKVIVKADEEAKIPIKHERNDEENNPTVYAEVQGQYSATSCTIRWTQEEQYE